MQREGKALGLALIWLGHIPVPKSYVFFVWVKFNSVEKTELAIAFRSPTMLHLYDVVAFFFCIHEVDN